MRFLASIAATVTFFGAFLDASIAMANEALIANLWSKFLNRCGHIVLNPDAQSIVQSGDPPMAVMSNSGGSEYYFEWADTVGESGAFADISRAGEVTAVTCGIVSHAEPAWDRQKISQLFSGMLSANANMKIEGGQLEVIPGIGLGKSMNFESIYHRFLVTGVFQGRPAVTRISIFDSGYEIDVFDIRNTEGTN